MKIVAIANTKGGVGKSTIACNFAVEAAKEKKKVLLVDSDVQGSSIGFRAMRENDDINALSIVTPTLHKDLPAMKSSFDLIIIDAGGRDGQVFRSALMASDIVVIPLLPSQYDIWAAGDSLDILKEARVYKKLAAVFLFNQVIQNTNIAKEASEALKEITTDNDIKLLDATLYSRVAYKASISKGLGVTEYEPNSKAALEIKQAYKEVTEELKNAKR